MSNPDYTKLVDAAVALRADSPVLWDQLVKAMLEYSTQVLVQLGQCPPELLVRAQGMSIQATEIAGILRDAPQIQEDRLKAIAAKNARTTPQRPGAGFRV